MLVPSISSHSCRARPRRCPAKSSSAVVRINAGSQSWNLISGSSPVKGSIGGALPLLFPVGATLTGQSAIGRRSALLVIGRGSVSSTGSVNIHNC